MRIDRLELKNFKKYEDATFEFPRSHDAAPGNGSFHVLIGENGSGKTTILDAAAVALGVWLEQPPDSSLANNRRRLAADQKRLVGGKSGDRVLFHRVAGAMSVRANGTILDDSNMSWGPTLETGKTNISNKSSKAVLKKIAAAFQQSERRLLPVICYYGAGRAWLAHNERKKLVTVHRVAELSF